MADTTHYRCSRDLLPMIEAALATNGYTIAIPYQRSISGAAAMIMANGRTSVLLGYPAQDELAEIEVWDEAQIGTSELLDSLCRVAEESQAEKEVGRYIRLVP
jgi:hypothetical protein